MFDFQFNQGDQEGMDPPISCDLDASSPPISEGFCACAHVLCTFAVTARKVARWRMIKADDESTSFAVVRGTAVNT